MAAILILYSTTDGHTREIGLRLKQVIERQHHRVSLHCLDDESAPNLQLFDKLVLGASIRYGKHSKQVYRFIRQNEKILDSKPNAFFSVNAVARKATKRTAESNPYVRKFLSQIAWQPDEVAVFAGKIDYPKYRFLDRWMIRFIMWLTKGPTDPNAVVEFTDWQQVEAFGNQIAQM